MTAATQESAPSGWSVERLHPVTRLILRWAFIALLTVVAFHRSLISAWDTTAGGGIGGYAWMVPAAAVLAAVGIARRHRTELPIHDRQTDIIVSIIGMVLSVLVQAVLLERYGAYFHLLRLDLVAMWLFIACASVAMFGLRPVMRFAWAWVVLVMVFPLPYYLMVILLGGSRFAAGVGTMVIAATATAAAVGRHVSRAMLGTTLCWLLGLGMLGAMAIVLPDAPLWAYQYVPSLTSICLVGSTMFLAARRGAAKRMLDRQIEPLAVRQIWSVVPLLVAVAVGMSLLRLPQIGLTAPAEVPTMGIDTALAPPPGWHVVDTQSFDWVDRLYGRGAVLTRQKMVADVGKPQYDKFGRPRAVVVDSIVTERPFSLNVYPARMLYRVKGIRLSGAQPVSLGSGVVADLFSAVDDRILASWDGLQWTWTDGERARRVLVIAVDNHEDWASFPQPTGGLSATLNSLFTVLFRGNSAAENSTPSFKDGDLLSEFGQALVHRTLESVKGRP